MYYKFNLLSSFYIPSFFCQLTIVPVSIVGESAGNCTLTWSGRSA